MAKQCGVLAIIDLLGTDAMTMNRKVFLALGDTCLLDEPCNNTCHGPSQAYMITTCAHHERLACQYRMRTSC